MSQPPVNLRRRHPQRQRLNTRDVIAIEVSPSHKVSAAAGADLVPDDLECSFNVLEPAGPAIYALLAGILSQSPVISVGAALRGSAAVARCAGLATFTCDAASACADSSRRYIASYPSAMLLAEKWRST